MKKLIYICIGIAVLLTSCAAPTTTAPPAAAPAPTATVTAPTPTLAPTLEPSPEAALSLTPTGRFEAGPCPFDVPQGAVIECGFVIVPEDHNQPEGPEIRLAVAIVKDQSPDHQPDPVILLSGGPGEKTVQSAQNVVYLFPHVHPNRDLIVFDQRGVGLSEPALECQEWIQAQYDLMDEEDAMLALETAFNTLMECRDRLVSEGYNLSAYNTNQSAADVEAIRQALGYEQINLLGGSYGSLLAQAVMREYPEHLRSVVMNSILPLDASFFIQAPLNTSNAVLNLLAACEADAACNAAYPELTQVFLDVVAQLNQEPVIITVTHALTGEDYEVLLTGDRAFSNLVGFLYQTQLIPLLPEAIYDVAKGDYNLMAQLQGLNLAMYEALSRGMTFSVLCAEDLIGKTEQDLLDVYAEIPGALAGRVDPEFAIQYSIFATCENWPVEQVDPAFKQPLVSDLPTLILEGEFDPVTPMDFAQQIAATLANSHVYEFPGVGHNILVATPCSRQMIGQFIQSPGEAPDAACINELGTGFALPYADPDGVYTLLLPPQWRAESEQGYVRLTDPDETIIGYVIVVDGHEFAESSAAAWAVVDSSFDQQPTVIPRPCTGCASAEAEQFALLSYPPTADGTTTLAAGWIYDGKVYYTLWQADPAALDTKSEQLNTVLTGFSISSLEPAPVAPTP